MEDKKYDLVKNYFKENPEDLDYFLARNNIRIGRYREDLSIVFDFLENTTKKSVTVFSDERYLLNSNEKVDFVCDALIDVSNQIEKLRDSEELELYKNLQKELNKEKVLFSKSRNKKIENQIKNLEDKYPLLRNYDKVSSTIHNFMFTFNARNSILKDDKINKTTFNNAFMNNILKDFYKALDRNHITVKFNKSLAKYDEKVDIYVRGKLLSSVEGSMNTAMEKMDFIYSVLESNKDKSYDVENAFNDLQKNEYIKNGVVNAYNNYRNSLSTNQKNNALEDMKNFNSVANDLIF